MLLLIVHFSFLQLTKLSEYHLKQLLESATCFNSENNHQVQEVGRIYSEQVGLIYIVQCTLSNE